MGVAHEKYSINKILLQSEVNFWILNRNGLGVCSKTILRGRYGVLRVGVVQKD